MHTNKDNKQINNLPDSISFQEWQWSVPLVQTLLKHNRDICCTKDIKTQRLTIYFNCRKCNWVSGRAWRRANLRSITNQTIPSTHQCSSLTLMDFPAFTKTSSWKHGHLAMGTQRSRSFRWRPSGHEQPSTGKKSVEQLCALEPSDMHVCWHLCNL